MESAATIQHHHERVAVRDAALDDLRAVARLEAEVFETPWDEPALERELSRPVASLRVATVQGQVAGHLLSWSAAGEAEVIVTAVDPEQRRQGVGWALLSDLVDRARQQAVERVFLEVRPSNTAALRLYGKAGFVELDRRPRYYKDGEDALVMALDLA